jgi:adenine-specific DNA-methyltransferase
VKGEDPDGVSKAVGWRAGGGFRFCHLAPSLLERDKWDNWVVSKEYNAAMLAEAMCKHMGFTYSPSQDASEYWNHGFSSERDFIYVTTQAVTHGMLVALSNDVGPERHLLVCCKAFSGRVDSFDNLTVRKIPQAVLANCEWGRDDYSLRIAALPVAGSDSESSSLDKNITATAQRGRKRKAISNTDEPNLFDAAAETGT